MHPRLPGTLGRVGCEANRRGGGQCGRKREPGDRVREQISAADLWLARDGADGSVQRETRSQRPQMPQGCSSHQELDSKESGLRRARNGAGKELVIRKHSTLVSHRGGLCGVLESVVLRLLSPCPLPGCGVRGRQAHVTSQWACAASTCCLPGLCCAAGVGVCVWTGDLGGSPQVLLCACVGASLSVGGSIGECL